MAGKILIYNNLGSKWHARRKLLTPSFHNKVMEDFAYTVQGGVQTFVECLAQQNGVFDIVPLAKLCTLDLICGMHIINRNMRYAKRRS